MSLEDLNKKLDDTKISEEEIEELKRRLEKSLKRFEEESLRNSYKEFLDRSYKL